MPIPQSNPLESVASDALRAELDRREALTAPQPEPKSPEEARAMSQAAWNDRLRTELGRTRGGVAS